MVLKHNQPLPKGWYRSPDKIKVGDIISVEERYGDHHGCALPAGFLYRVIGLSEPPYIFIVRGLREEDAEQLEEHIHDREPARGWCQEAHVYKVIPVNNGECGSCSSTCKRDEPCPFYKYIGE